MSKAIIFYGGVPVPYTVSWSNEARPHLAFCKHARARAISYDDARGVGKPRFADPHPNRMREVMAKGLCDLCAKPLNARTKVSLSKARPQVHAASPMDVLQVEPLLHRECAAVCIEHCPSLQRDIRQGTLQIRQVLAWKCQFAIYSAEGVFELTGERTKAICYSKVQLVKWIDRDFNWLSGKGGMQ
jgi:hypothetical protein